MYTAEELAKGTKVQYLNQNGMMWDRLNANRYLETNGTYTIHFLEMLTWDSYVYLEEVPHVPFNVKMFKKV